MFDASALLPELSTGWQAWGMVQTLDPSHRPEWRAKTAAEDTNPALYAFGLSQADAEEFRGIIHAECAEDMSPRDTWQRATEVIAMFRMLLGPLPEDTTASTYPQS